MRSKIIKEAINTVEKFNSDYIYCEDFENGWYMTFDFEPISESYAIRLNELVIWTNEDDMSRYNYELDKFDSLEDALILAIETKIKELSTCLTNIKVMKNK